ncbi:MAG TPA: TonB-dependent receptor plug domain-containing protein, partial [Bacteroidia bacterium]
MLLKLLKTILILLSLYQTIDAAAQSVIIGQVTHEGKKLKGVKIILHLNNNQIQTQTDTGGHFKFTELKNGHFYINVSSTLYSDTMAEFMINSDTVIRIKFDLYRAGETFREVVVSGSLKPVKRTESPVNIEVYTPTFFKRNPTPNLFEALQNVNGVRPQINCNVCNTGDIHINGLEGPYTMVLIDGMPIVSSLSTVYGLFGIPNSLIERIEIVKGPASTLYGSEAVGGLVNVITKKPFNSPKLTIDVMGTSWGELNNDIGIRGNLGKKIDVLTGINFFYFNQTFDKNKDGFTDVTLQNRISVFQKLRVERKNNKEFNLAGRYMYETRWGGQTNWNIKFRGGDSIYAESIFTSRIEAFGNYQLPVKSDLNLSFSINRHHQNSAYGTNLFNATQSILFAQLTDIRKYKRHELLSGLAFRY